MSGEVHSASDAGFLGAIVRRIPEAALALGLAAALAAAACLIGLEVSKRYYETAPYHYDSASHRWQAVESYDRIAKEGREGAILASAIRKDALDVTLRLAIAPRLLLYRHGHLAVALPFAGLFFALLVGWVQRESGSWLLGVAAAATLFVFPFPYEPVGGLADYWKDSLGTWLLGASVSSWIWSQTRVRLRWSALSGLLLGLLAWQRATAAVYAGLLFAPLVLLRAIRSARQAGVRPALLEAGAFAAPGLALAGLLGALQGKSLYEYYFVVGYGYGSPGDVAQYIQENFSRLLGLGPALAAAFAVVGLGACAWRKEWRPGLGTALWFAAGFPVLVIATRAVYFGMFALWTSLLVALAGTALPFSNHERRNRTMALGILCLVLPLAVGQYDRTLVEALDRARTEAGKRATYAEISAWLQSHPRPWRHGMTFDEVELLVSNQMFFEERVRLNPPELFMSVHDSYYRAAFGNATPEKVGERNFGRLETGEGALVVGQGVPEDVLGRIDFAAGQNPFAARAALEMNRRLFESPRWRAVRWLGSPWGPLCFFELSSRPLSPVEKWGGLTASGSLTGIPVALGLGPGVKLYDYRSRIPPEEVDGIPVQWLPIAPDGVALTLFSDAPRRVALRGLAASATPGVSVFVSAGGRESAVEAGTGTELSLSVDLAPGLDRVRIGARLSPGAPRAEGKALRLTAPRLESPP